MEPFEDRPNPDQFSQFIRKEPADREEGCVVCVCMWEGSRLQNINYTCDLTDPTVRPHWHTQFVLMIVSRVVIK